MIYIYIYIITFAISSLDCKLSSQPFSASSASNDIINKSYIGNFCVKFIKPKFENCRNTN